MVDADSMRWVLSSRDENVVEVDFDAWRLETGFWWGSSATWLRLLALAISLNRAIRFSLTLTKTAANLYHLQFLFLILPSAAAEGAP